MKKRVLIIDDEDQSEEIINLERQFKKKGLDVEFLQFNIGKPGELEVLTENRIDIEKVKNIFQERYGMKRLHLICFDYELGPEDITGVDVLAALKPLTDRTLFLFYSSKIRQILEKILTKYRDGGMPFDKARELLDSLVTSKVEYFVDRGGDLGNAVNQILARSGETLDDIFEEKMWEYPNFKTDYFDGLEIRNVEQLLNNKDGRAIKVKRELVEQLVAYFIRLKDEE